MDELERPLKRLKLSLHQEQKTLSPPKPRSAFPKLPEYLIGKVISYFPNPDFLEEFLENSSDKYTEIVNKYRLEDRIYENFVINTPCPGCRFKAPGQRDHMEPPNGCLYDNRYEGVIILDPLYSMPTITFSDLYPNIY